MLIKNKKKKVAFLGHKMFSIYPMDKSNRETNNVN